jgi:putative FmdB family regulatory protein
MPLYEYACPACAHRFESLQRSFRERASCPSCGARDAERLLSTFAMSSGAAGREAVPPARAQGGGSCCGGGCGCAH